jgi:ribosomal-protein-alanine N-acetyltransferase
MTCPASAQVLIIDPAREDDSEALARLHQALFDSPWDAASFVRLLAHPGAIAFVARTESSDIAGFGLGQIAADEAEILTLGVATQWHGRRIGELLVEALSQAARNKQVARLYLEVAESNLAARTLYRRLGFKETGRRKGYYARPGATAEDAINLALAL